MIADHPYDMDDMEILKKDDSQDCHQSLSASTSKEGGARSRPTEWRYGVSGLDSDDDELSFDGFKSLSNSVIKHVNVEDHKDTEDVDEISSSMEMDGEIFAKLHDPDVEGKLKSNTNCKRSHPAESQSDDVKFMYDAAKKNKIPKSTVKTEPHYELMNPEVSLAIFNFQTLKLEHFIPNGISTYPELFSATFEQLLTSKSLLAMDCNKKDEEGLCTFCLYLMSVHPVSHVTDMCFEFLRYKSYFCPSFSDFINIFRNWGYELEKLYRSIPVIYTGIHEGITRVHPKHSKKTKEHNFHIVFTYLKYLVEIHYPDTFFNLIEPLIRIMFDVNIFDTSSLQIKVYQILVLFVDSDNDSTNKPGSKSILVKDIHLMDLSLQQQTYFCTKVIRYTRFGVLLGYAALQQFLGCSDLIYSENVTVKDLYDLLIGQEKKIRKSSYLKIFCFLQIIDLFLFHVKLVDGEVCEENINHENWHDLLNNWALLVCGRRNRLDTMYVKDKIAQIKYLLNMKLASEGLLRRDFTI